MGKHTFFVVLALTILWMILAEEISWRILAIGLFVSLGSVHFSSKYLALSEIANVNFTKLITYPFFLMGQIYLAGFNVIKLIFTGARVDVVTVQCKLKNDVLRIMLMESITLTPGTIFLDLKEEFAAVLWMRNENTPLDHDATDEIILGSIEERLLKAQVEATSAEFEQEDEEEGL